MRAHAAKIVRLMPSLTDVAFLMPVLFLFGKLEGARTLLGDGDTGWHIRAGEWMLAHGRVPWQDLFSFTRPDAPWYAWEWLADVMMAWLHQQGGMAAVVLAAMLVLSLSFALLYRFVRDACGNVVVAIAITFLAVAGSSIHWLARPHLLTLLFAVIFCRILWSGRNLWLLPVLIIPWTNLHGGFFVGILFTMAYAAGEFLSAPRGERLSRSRRYWLAAGASALATLLNPYSYHLHVHIAGYLRTNYHFEHIYEFMSLNFHHPAAIYFEIALALGMAAAFWHISHRRYTEGLLLAGWGHLALVSARNIPIFLIVAAAPIAVAISAWLNRAAPDWFAGFATRLRAIDCLPRVPALPLAICIVLGTTFYAPHVDARLRAEFDPHHYPAAAVSMLQTQGAGRIFTDDEWGDYLIYRLYPVTRVFVDGRSDFYGSDFNLNYLNILKVRYDWQENLGRYAVDTVLLPTDAPLAGALKESRRWRAVYDDGVAVVFRAQSALGAEPLSGGKRLVVLPATGSLPPENPKNKLGAN
jgi:hypothetical protein